MAQCRMVKQDAKTPTTAWQCQRDEADPVHELPSPEHCKTVGPWLTPEEWLKVRDGVKA